MVQVQVQLLRFRISKYTRLQKPEIKIRVLRWEHMQQSHDERNFCLHCAAMDEAGAESQLYLLAKADKNADKGAIRVTEAAAIATMHTFTLASYSSILKKYGVVERNSKAFGSNRTGGLSEQENELLDTAAVDELDLYISDRYIPRLEDADRTLLERWLDSEKRGRYPLLSKMAIDTYSIPAMSAEPERVFSGTKRTNLDQRGRLRSETIELLKCLKL